jgi:hypothetical protein
VADWLSPPIYQRVSGRLRVPFLRNIHHEEYIADGYFREDNTEFEIPTTRRRFGKIKIKEKTFRSLAGAAGQLKFQNISSAAVQLRRR